MICRYCGNEFEPKKRGRKNTGFCCHKCADAWRQHNVYDLMPKKFTKQCDFCGESFQTNRENQKYCSTQCGHAAQKTGRTEYTKTCLYCSTEFKTIYKAYKYCTSACASRHAADLRRGEYFCEYCGQPRHSDHPNRNRFCSRECAMKVRSLEALRRNQEKKRQHEIDMTRQCDFCGETFVAVSNVNRFCSYECYYSGALQERHETNLQRFTPKRRTCPKCGVQFITTLRTQRKIYCSERCEDVAHDDRRAEQFKAAFVEPVGLITTYKSYKGICGICGLPVPNCNDPANEWGPTIDHIVPLSKGGKHMKSNCQLAHRLCNSLKLDTTEDFEVDWKQKLIDEPGRWNARLDTLWDQLGAADHKKAPVRIAIQPTTTIRAGLWAGAAPTGPRSNF